MGLGRGRGSRICVGRSHDRTRLGAQRLFSLSAAGTGKREDERETRHDCTMLGMRPARARWNLRLPSDDGQTLGPAFQRRWLNSTPRMEKPEIPSFRGELTIADVRDAPDPEAYGQAVELWARSTWKAYSALHSLARQWIQQALAGQGRSRRKMERGAGQIRTAE